MTLREGLQDARARGSAAVRHVPPPFSTTARPVLVVWVEQSHVAARALLASHPWCPGDPRRGVRPTLLVGVVGRREWISTVRDDGGRRPLTVALVRRLRLRFGRFSHGCISARGA